MQILLLAPALVILSLLGSTLTEAHGNRWTTPTTQRGPRLPDTSNAHKPPLIPVYRENFLDGRLKEIHPLYSLLMGYYSLDVVMAGGIGGINQKEGLSDYRPNVKLAKDTTVRLTFSQYRLPRHSARGAQRGMRLSVKAMRPADPQRTQRRSRAQFLTEVQDHELFEVDENCDPDQPQCVSPEIMGAILAKREPLVLQPLVQTKFATVAAMGFRHQDFRYLSPYGFRMPGCIYTYTFWIRFHSEGTDGPFESLKNGYYAFQIENVKKRWWKVWTRHYSAYRSALSGPFLLTKRVRPVGKWNFTPTLSSGKEASLDEENDIYEDAPEEQLDSSRIDALSAKLIKESARGPKSHRIDVLEEFTDDDEED